MINRLPLVYSGRSRDAAVDAGGSLVAPRSRTDGDAPRKAVAPAARRRRRVLRMSGYQPRRPALYRAWNVAAALLLLLAALPLMLLIALALAATQGPGNILYRGERVGRNGRPFRIVKFKTLRDEAARLTADRTLPPDSRMETPLGGALRDTRLDELPQLFNVLIGDMNLLGPRPVRPSIAEKYRRVIPDYDSRFAVKPGLIGYTQALMAHSTDKAIRARVNAALCRRPVSLLQEILFVIVTGLSVLRWVGRVARRSVMKALPASWRGRSDARGAVRIEESGEPDLDLRLVAIDASSLEVECDAPLRLSDAAIPLSIRSGGAGRRRVARCRATILAHTVLADGKAAGPGGARHRYTMTYAPNSAFQKYLIERYVIGSVLVQ